MVIADLNEEVGSTAANQLHNNGWKAEFVKTDVADEKQVKEVTDFAVKSYGSIDILVNNAGIYPIIPVMQMSVADFEKLLAVNLKSVFFSLNQRQSNDQARQGGKIINITSIDALHPSSVGLAVYDASKHCSKTYA